MTIKEVSEKYDISSDTLRYYERIGMIPEVTRTASGIRDYQESDFGNYKIYVKNIKPSKIKRINVKNTKSKEVKISWSKISDASGYEVQTATDKKFTNSKTFDESDANIKLYSRSKGTFYVRIRAYKTIDGTTYYGNYSSIKKIKFK